MKTKTFKVVYDGPLNRELDEKITEALKTIGAEWYASGTCIGTGERDMAFDIEVDE